MDRKNLQILVDQTVSGERLKLMPGEYQGPVTISKPIVLEGRVEDGKIRTTIWCRQGPVIIISSDDVRLINICVEVTQPNDTNNDDSNIAIKSETGAEVELDNINVRGRLVGIDDEAGDWMLPSSIYLGELAAKKINRFTIKLYVPVECQVSSNISGVDIKPIKLQPGLNELFIEVVDLCKDCFISGNVLVKSAFVHRSIEITGRTPPISEINPESSKLLWEPKKLPAPEPNESLPPIIEELSQNSKLDSTSRSEDIVGQSNETSLTDKSVSLDQILTQKSKTNNISHITGPIELLEQSRRSSMERSLNQILEISPDNKSIKKLKHILYNIKSYQDSLLEIKNILPVDDYELTLKKIEELAQKCLNHEEVDLTKISKGLTQSQKELDEAIQLNAEHKSIAARLHYKLFLDKIFRIVEENEQTTTNHWELVPKNSLEDNNEIGTIITLSKENDKPQIITEEQQDTSQVQVNSCSIHSLEPLRIKQDDNESLTSQFNSDHKNNNYIIGIFFFIIVVFFALQQWNSFTQNETKVKAMQYVATSNEILNSVEERLLFYKKNPPSQEDIKNIKQVILEKCNNALNAAKEAKQLNPSNLKARICIIQAYRFMGNYKEAKQEANEAIHLFSDDPEIKSELQILKSK